MKLNSPKNSRRPNETHLPPSRHTSGAFVWKCRNRTCGYSTPDFDHPEHTPRLCPNCGGVLDWTPTRRIPN